MSRPIRRRRGLLALVAAPLLTVPLLVAPTSASEVDEPVVTDPEPTSLVRLIVPDAETIDRLNEDGYDLAHYTRPVTGGIEIHVVATDAELDALRARGVAVLGSLEDETTLAEVKAERHATITETDATTDTTTQAATDTLTPLRAEWFTSIGDIAYLNLEVKSDAPGAPVVTASWGDTTVTLQRFTDAGQYMYHRTSSPIKVDEVPSEVTFTSDGGGTVTVPLTQWLGGDRKDPSPHYASGFVDHYMDPTEVTERIEDLATEFPELSEIVELPHLSNGYRRHAQVTVGTVTSHAFYVTSEAWGHEGGNDLVLRLVDGDALAVTVDGSTVTVTVAPDTTGTHVVEAINAETDSPMTADLYRTGNGSGVVTARGDFALSDNLNAPPEISRDPFQVKAIRIGEQRDGSQTGVMLYCQEHAREWVTPLSCVETAERLLRNYQHDPGTRKLLQGLDVFVVPTINPDGGHYSFYDYNSQRKSMVNHCDASGSDPARRNSWGVDLNRNFAAGSHADGYVGGSGNCLSGTYSGPDELSEPEAQNEVWLTEQFDNIAFAMNTHSYGGYFMWAPGSYTPDRTSLPRPDFGTEEYYWEASEHILNAIQDHRGTAIWPGRTGPVVDVLYSAAGNSADHHWYESGIYAWNFEVGADLWDDAAGRWRGVGFQPPFAEGYEEAMEFSSGQIGMLEVALKQASDVRPPTSSLTVTETEDGSTSFVITANEPATVYYTTDGSRPTYDSPTVQSAGLREGPAEITVTSTTKVNWFAVDMAGHAERNYDPDSKARNYRTETVRVD